MHSSIHATARGEPGSARRILPIPSLLVVLSLVLPPALGVASTLSETGQWTPDEAWGTQADNRYAVHLALLPGAGNPHSHVLFWNNSFTSIFRGHDWGWNPGNDGCGAFPSASFTDILVPGVNVNLFCSGNTLLPDGRAVMPGGTEPVTGTYGENRVRIFTPGPGYSSGSWSDPGRMADWRWYPAATSLRDGRVLVISGSRHPFHRIFGGRRGGAAPASPTGDSLYRFAPVNGGAWESSQLPAEQPGVGRPDVREGHSFVAMTGVPGFGAEVLFGGRDGTDHTRNDTWFLYADANVTGPATTYRWSEVIAQGTAPALRTEHTALSVLNTEMVVFGGVGENNAVYDDVRRLVQLPGCPPLGSRDDLRQSSIRALRP